jgi:multidrug efflux pump subunit AcrA (membrane-fusion protein)
VPPAATATPTATDSAGSHVQTVALRVADASAASPTPSVNPQQVAQARAQVYQAQAQLAQAQKALDETVLTAPVAGTVQAINGSLGGASVAGGQAGAAGTSSGSTSSGSSGFVVLTDLGQLQVKGEIAEADIAKVQVGQPVTYTFATSSASAAGAPAVTGSVQSIDVTATVSNNVVEYGVTLSVEDPPAGLRLGQTATASIQTGSVDGALYVPSTAVTTLGTRSTVTVQDGSGTHVVPVTLGLVGDADTQITSGLSEGQTVVLPTTTTTGGTGTARFPGLGGGGLGGFGR